MEIFVRSVKEEFMSYNNMYGNNNNNEFSQKKENSSGHFDDIHYTKLCDGKNSQICHLRHQWMSRMESEHECKKGKNSTLSYLTVIDTHTYINTLTSIIYLMI